MAIEGQRKMSKTQHYRKVTKPLLERKRRARMNHYLDELKELIVETMESQGEHITKLEKADILELTVTYLKSKKKLHHQGSESAEKFRAGYTQAAYEVSKVFASVPGIDVHFGTKLMKHLGYQLKDLRPTRPATNHPDYLAQREVLSPPQSPEPRDMNERLPEVKSNDVWRPW